HETATKQLPFQIRVYPRRSALNLSLKPKRQEWPWRRPFEKPTGSNPQSMVPCRQPRRVQREPRLTRERATKRLACCQHCCAFGPQAERLTKLLEVSRLHFPSFEISLDVIARETRLLKRKLRRPGERRRRIRIECNVTQRENIHLLRQLQGRLHHQQPARALFHVEVLDHGIHLHAARPYDRRSLQTLLTTLLLKRDPVWRYFHYPRLGMYFNVRLAQRVFDDHSYLIAHAGNNAVAHLDHEHARLAL